MARFLQQQSGDREWERILAERRSYPKLEQFAADALREGSSEPLEFQFSSARRRAKLRT
jgi:hypothetical protein